MNWGLKILIAYLIFVGGILYLVIRASGEKFDLVEPDYYNVELNYQKRIDQQKRTANLSAFPKITQSNDGMISVVFPDEMKEKKINGEVFLYAPSDAKKDFKQRFQCTDSLLMKIPQKLSGFFHIKLEWEADGKTYFHQESLML
jgi:hypothetical protein